MVMLLFFIICSLGCNKKDATQDIGNIAIISNSESGVFNGTVALSKNFIIELDNKYKLSWPKKSHNGWFFLDTSYMHISIVLSTTNSQDKANHRIAIREYEKPEEFSIGDVEYLGSYVSRVSLEDSNQGFIGIVYKGNNQLDLEFSFSDIQYLDEAKKIWKSTH